MGFIFYMPKQALLRSEPPPNVNSAAWRCFKFYGRCFTAAVSVAMIVYIFMARHFNWDPDVQDPYRMIALLVMSLMPVGFGFMMTQGYTETQDNTQLQEKAHV